MQGHERVRRAAIGAAIMVLIVLSIIALIVRPKITLVWFRVLASASKYLVRSTKTLAILNWCSFGLGAVIYWIGIEGWPRGGGWRPWRSSGDDERSGDDESSTWQKLCAIASDLRPHLGVPAAWDSLICHFLARALIDNSLEYATLQFIQRFPIGSYIWAPLNFLNWYMIAMAFKERRYNLFHHLCIVGVIITAPVTGPYNDTKFLIAMCVVVSSLATPVEVWLVHRKAHSDESFPTVENQVSETKYFDLAGVLAVCGFQSRATTSAMLIILGWIGGWQMSLVIETVERREIPGAWVAGVLVAIQAATLIMVNMYPESKQYIKQECINAGCVGAAVSSIQGLLQVFTAAGLDAGKISDWLSSHPGLIFPATGVSLILYMSVKVLDSESSTNDTPSGDNVTGPLQSGTHQNVPEGVASEVSPLSSQTPHLYGATSVQGDRTSGQPSLPVGDSIVEQISPASPRQATPGQLQNPGSDTASRQGPSSARDDRAVEEPSSPSGGDGSLQQPSVREGDEVPVHSSSSITPRSQEPVPKAAEDSTVSATEAAAILSTNPRKSSEEGSVVEMSTLPGIDHDGETTTSDSLP